MVNVVLCRIKRSVFILSTVGIIGYIAVSWTTNYATSTNQHSTSQPMQTSSAQYSKIWSTGEKQKIGLDRHPQIGYSNTSWLTEEQRRRVELLDRECLQLSDAERSLVPNWDDFLVDDRLRYIYCKVEKVACTTWKRTLLWLTGNFTSQQAANLDFFRVHNKQFLYSYLRPLSAYTSQEIRDRLDSYFKFMFVRDPLERLVSAFRDKMFSDDEPPYKKLSRRIRRNFHQRGDKTPLAGLVRYMIRQVERGRQLDIHWRPQSAICRPCYVHYHFVGHYQSLLTDADHVLQHITTTTHDAAKFPRVDPDNQHHKRPSKELASVYYGLLDRAL